MNHIFLLFILAVIVTLVVRFCRLFLIRSTKQSNDHPCSPTECFGISRYAQFIFSLGRPKYILITGQNKIFYGPVGGLFNQVPPDLIPAMTEDEQHALGKEFIARYSYRCEAESYDHFPEIQLACSRYLDTDIKILLTRE